MATILLIEDHEDTREIYRAVLTTAGYTVVVAKSPRDALRRMARVKPDLVLMDLGLGGEGFSVATRIAASLKAPPIMAVTGRDREGVPEENVFVDYLLKPIMPDALVDAVRRVLSA